MLNIYSSLPVIILLMLHTFKMKKCNFKCLQHNFLIICQSQSIKTYRLREDGLGFGAFVSWCLVWFSLMVCFALVGTVKKVIWV